ncbi:MAG: c-type cytochrome biogenesis protein CcsB [Mariprofundaceae bacterium]|nr:c-type cytochrome biogenesis protein CcsB [Mariprofundaceae bacterium]
MSTAIQSTAMASPWFQGKPALIRYWAYLGLITGAAGLALFGGDGYSENSYLSLLISMQGVIWLGTGALLAAALAVINAMLRPESATSPVAERLVAWGDGAIIMIAMMAVFTLFEPVSSAISYEDQSNMFSINLIMAMNVVFLFSAICYILLLFAPDSFVGRMATTSAWMGIYIGGSMLLLRWYESYLFMDGSIGHAPVSNLYEVFMLLFCIVAIIYLQWEKRYQAQAMGAFVMTLVAAGVFFEIWLASIGQADIKPLVPALQSYWMKIHVPLNFVGYGSFAVACGAGMTYLTREWLENHKPNGTMLKAFPTLEQLDELGYKSVAVGFPAFTLATILGAAWAAEAWGGYWSWDPKETWALIVWLVYAAYLHVRIQHGWGGRTLAWWTVAGFLITVFCFLGVNMYLSGLHSYGRLA